MITPDILNYLFTEAPLLIAKILVLILLLVHLVFSLVVLRQTKLMIKVVEANISKGIYIFALLHLAASIFVFMWTLLFL